VIIVSVREQTLRAYDNGHLVFWTYITSGRPELPSPPGFWHVLARQQDIVFTSSEPVGSQYWYAPTLVHYALLFHDGGFYVHDAWWRLHFGPGSNLPHYDPQAFNGGSHGCVNVPLQQMTWLFQWAEVGTPVIVY
jgi:lipoprotein-anchoring transpeptidase ErfK/SrfK